MGKSKGYISDCLDRLPLGTISDDYVNEYGIDINSDDGPFFHLEYGSPSRDYLDDDGLETEDQIPEKSLLTEESPPKQEAATEEKETESKGIEYDLCKEILEKYHMASCQGKLYQYHSESGCFHELSNTELRVLVRNCWPENIVRILNRYKVDEIIDRLVHWDEIQIHVDYFDGYPHLINFRNCVLNTETMETCTHNPQFYFTSYIDADYSDEDSELYGIFLDFIHKCTQGDGRKIELLQEVIGYCLSNYCNAKKWFAFIGVPHSGKSTILDILKHLIGAQFTSAIPLHRLSERFLIAELFKKKLNISGELHNGDIQHFDTLKSMTGNDVLVAEKKGKDPFYFTNKAKLLFAGNQMPSVAKLDSTSAFADRIIFLLFNYTVPDKDRDYNLIEKILRERDQIVRWAVDGLRRLVRKRFIFTEPEDSKLFKRQYLQSLNNVGEFVRDKCKVNADYQTYRVLKKDLYGEYIKYCNQNCMKVLTKEEFFAEIIKLPVKLDKFRYRGSNPLYGYLGIALQTQLNV